jgi:hypothetical protein
MHKFIHDANVSHFSELLDRTTDEDERARIISLLAEEIAGDAALRAATNVHSNARLLMSGVGEKWDGKCSQVSAYSRWRKP